AVLAAGGGGERVEADLVGAALGVCAGGDDADGLAGGAVMDELRAGDVELDVADEAGGLSPGADLGLVDAGGHRLVGPVEVHLHFGERDLAAGGGGVGL